MSKNEVLEQIYPEEVGYLIDQATLNRKQKLKELALAIHDPKQLFKAEPIKGKSGIMALAQMAGNQKMAKKIQLYERAAELMGRNG